MLVPNGCKAVKRSQFFLFCERDNDDRIRKIRVVTPRGTDFEVTGKVAHWKVISGSKLFDLGRLHTRQNDARLCVAPNEGAEKRIILKRCSLQKAHARLTFGY